MHRTRHSLLLALSLVVSGLLATQSTAHADRIDMSIGSTIRYAGSASVDALSADDGHAFFSAVAAVRLDRPLIPGFDVFVEGTYERGSIEGTSLMRIDSKSTITGALLGGRLQRRLPRTTTAFVRAGLGFNKLSLSIKDRQSRAGDLRDSAYVPAAYGAAGLEIMPIRHRDANGVVRFAVGLRLEVGYVATSSAEMHANPDHDGGGDALRIPTASASLGSLNASGRTYRVGVVGRF